MDRVMRMQKKICKQLDNYGYKWELYEGSLIVAKRELSFRVKIFKSFDWRTYVLLLDYCFDNEAVKDANPDVLNRIVCQVNYDNVDVKFVQFGECDFLCRFKSHIRRASDFVKVFEHGFANIIETVDEFYEGAEVLKQDLKPANSIGFVRQNANTKTVAAEQKDKEVK